MFHVLQLKKQLDREVVSILQLPPMDVHGLLKPELEEILDRRLRKVNQRALTEVLVRWQGQIAEDATWELYHKLKNTFHHLVGKVF